MIFSEPHLNVFSPEFTLGINHKSDVNRQFKDYIFKIWVTCLRSQWFDKTNFSQLGVNRVWRKSFSNHDLHKADSHLYHPSFSILTNPIVLGTGTILCLSGLWSIDSIPMMEPSRVCFCDKGWLLMEHAPFCGGVETGGVETHLLYV